MDAKKYKIGIIGLGPVGQILAVHFKQAGCEVAICDLDIDKLNLIRSKGIELFGKVKKQNISSMFIIQSMNYSPIILKFLSAL